MDILGTLFFNPFINLLFLLYKLLGNDMGLAIIGLTILFKLVTLPLNLRMLRSQRRMQQLKPQLDKLKQQHGADKMALAQAQMELYKAEGVSPAGACLPMLLQLPFLFGLYHAFQFITANHTIAEVNKVLYTAWLHLPGDSALLIKEAVNIHFLWLDLSKADPYFILPLLAALTQFVVSKMMMPPKSVLPQPQNKTEVSLENSLVAAQGQMMYLFPIITFIINLQFPSGLSLYWTVGNIFSIIQQIYINKKMPIMAINQQGELVPADQLEHQNTIEGQIIAETKNSQSKPSDKKKKKAKKKK